jgi:hypothetical protein
VLEGTDRLGKEWRYYKKELMKEKREAKQMEKRMN